MTRRSGSRLTWSIVAIAVSAAPAWAESWTLTDQERRLYLGYYAPIIFKSADEGARKHHGYDWITNFDFDRDDVYANNKANWEDIDRFVASEPRLTTARPKRWASWQIRPTLYTAIIEFMQDDRKSVVLLYHIYHAKQQNSIHDWERVEIRVDGVQGTPGADGERIAYAVITTHGKHDHRGPGDAGWNFWQTGFGKHLMVWQAPWSLALGFDRGELRWVEAAQRVVAEQARGDARADLTISGARRPRKVNYVFVCDCDPEATRDWRAQRINQDNAWAAAAKISGRASWQEVPRITYELQDVADILPSHWSGNPYEMHWTPPGRPIELESPIRSENGTTLVPAGRQMFFVRAYDMEDPEEHRGGYLKKHWFWGTYLFGRSGSFRREAFHKGAPRAGRGAASGRPEAHGSYWWQHDYFAHDGLEGDGKIANERGRWLPSDWYTAAKGGFDGRWVQLFPDNPLELEARVPAPVDGVAPRPAELLDLADRATSASSQ